METNSFSSLNYTLEQFREITNNLNTVSQNIATTTSEISDIAESLSTVGEDIKNIFTTTVEGASLFLQTVWSDQLNQVGTSITTAWINLLNSTFLEIQQNINTTWLLLLDGLFTAVDSAVQATLNNIENTIIDLYGKTITVTYDDIKSTALLKYQEIFDFVTGAWAQTIEPTISCCKEAVVEIKNAALGFLNNYIVPIAAFLKSKLADNWDKTLEEILDIFTKIIEKIIPSINDSIEIIVEKSINLMNKLLSSLQESLQNIMNSVFPLIKTVIAAIVTLIGTIIGSFIGGPIGAAIGGLAGLGISSILAAVIKTPTIKLEKLDYPDKYPKIELNATGGFPSMGQMFIAREAGPELVGTIGSRNAVVNNDQIVESVSAGVYKAVREAMNGGQANGQKAVITLDKRVLGEFTIGYINGKTKETGLSPILV